MACHDSPMSRMLVLKGLALPVCRKVCLGKRQALMCLPSNVQKCSHSHTTHAVLPLKALTKVKCDWAFIQSFPPLPFSTMKKISI